MTYRSSISRHQFIIFRVLSGLGLTSFFLGSLSDVSYQDFWAPYFPQIPWESLVNRFPNILELLGSPYWPLIGMAVLSLLISLGLGRKFLSSLLVYGLGCLHHSQYLSITPNSLAIMFLLLILMVVPEAESRAKKDQWRFPKPLFQVSSVILVFFYVLYVSPFQLPSRLMLPEGQVLVSHLSLEMQVFFSLMILLIPLKSIRWVFWLACVALFFVVMSGAAGWMNSWYLLPFLIIGIDPAWFSPDEDSEADMLVFYDGSCGLCHGFVQFLLEVDGRERITFSALQSPYAQSVLKESPQYSQELSSVVVLSQNQLLDQSSAVVRILKELGGMWSMAGHLLSVIPQKGRDALYQMISKKRYQWFGKKEDCPLPSPEQRARFIEGLSQE